MRSPGGLAFFLACHLFEGEVTHRLQETEAETSLTILLADNQTLVDQRGQALHPVDRLGRLVGDDRLGRLQRESTDKDPQAAEQNLLLLGEEVIAPGDG